MNLLPLCTGGIIALIASGCAAPPHAPPARTVRWDPVVVWEGDAAFERVKIGRPDASDPLPQIVGLDQAGRMVLVHWNGGHSPRAEVVYENHSEMTGLAIADVDPSVTGQEIYAGAYEPGKDEVGGAVLQVSVDHGRASARQIFSPGAYVHSIEVVPPATPGAAPQLVVGTYAGEIYVLSPSKGVGPWSSRLVYRDPPIKDPQPKDQRPRIKDMALLRDPNGRPPHEVFAVFAGGRAIAVDLDLPESAVIVAEESGGWGRTCADEGTGAYACGYSGRVVHFRRDAAGAFTSEVLDQEGIDSGLRGVVTGRFPLPGCGGEVAPIAIFGFHAHCRALMPRRGAWDPVTLYTDIGRGHTLVAADLVPGDDADELVISGYSKHIAVLVPVRE